MSSDDGVRRREELKTGEVAIGTPDGFESAGMSVRTVGECIVIVHGTTDPSDLEWERGLELLRAVGPRRAKALVWSEGGSPSAKQRAALEATCGGATPRTALVTESLVSRAAGTAVSWFNPQLKTFAPTALEAALDHLDLTPERRKLAIEAVTAMRSRPRR
jgi:hypothetical protein